MLCYTHITVVVVVELELSTALLEGKVVEVCSRLL